MILCIAGETAELYVPFDSGGYFSNTHTHTGGGVSRVVGGQQNITDRNIFNTSVSKINFVSVAIKLGNTGPHSDHHI